jgi:hypothetical protein
MMTTRSKRAFLQGAAAVAAATIPAAGALAGPNPDAALLALQGELDAADEAWEALHQKQNAAEKVCWALRPDKPQEPRSPNSVMDAFWAGDSRPLIEASKAPDTDYGEALAAWREAMEQAELDSGFKAAEEAVNAADHVRLAIRDKIVATRARTLNGLTFKARYAADHFPGDEDEDVMKSIVEDLLAMAGAAS